MQYSLKKHCLRLVFSVMQCDIQSSQMTAIWMTEWWHYFNGSNATETRQRQHMHLASFARVDAIVKSRRLITTHSTRWSLQLLARQRRAATAATAADGWDRHWRRRQTSSGHEQLSHRPHHRRRLRRRWRRRGTRHGWRQKRHWHTLLLLLLVEVKRLHMMMVMQCRRRRLLTVHHLLCSYLLTNTTKIMKINDNH